jgi:hypothetical protein
MEKSGPVLNTDHTIRRLQKAVISVSYLQDCQKLWFAQHIGTRLISVCPAGYPQHINARMAIITMDFS